MIITTNFLISKRGRNVGGIIRGQLVDCICENCGKEFKRPYYVAIKQPKYCNFCSASLRITKYNKSCAGKNFDERFGEEKSKIIRNKMSKKLSLRRTEGDLVNQTWTIYNQKQKGKTWEERFGKEKAKKIKQKLSDAFSGSKNNMFGKPSPNGSGNGWSGWYKGLYFRSMLELSFLVKNFNESLKSAENISIEYIDYAGSERTYHPDFIDCKFLIEIKPKNLINSKNNKLKFSAAKEYCKKNNLIFKIYTEDNINKLSNEEIKNLYMSKEIKFIDRYDSLYKEKYL